MCPLPLTPPSHLPPHAAPLGCHRAPALSSLSRRANSHWLSVLPTVMYMFQMLLSQIIPALQDRILIIGVHDQISIQKIIIEKWKTNIKNVNGDIKMAKS